MIFKPGDPVWAHCKREDINPPLMGKHMAIVERRVTWLMQKLDRRLDCDYLIEVAGRPGPCRGMWGAYAINLTPRQDDFNSDIQTGKWDMCPWKPTVKIDATSPVTVNEGQK